jgi:hypothetical protein
VTPTLSLEAVQDRLICELETAVAVRLVGTVGGSVSGGTTVTTAADEVEPSVFVALRVYVVVWLGETVREARPVTSPTPLSMVKVGAGLPETDQDRAVDWPLLIVVGEALNDEMTGAEGPWDAAGTTSK